jgi:hypothetical protein
VEAWKLKLELWSVFKPVVTELHQFDKERIQILIRIKVISRIRIRIKVKVMRIRNTAGYAPQ